MSSHARDNAAVGAKARLDFHCLGQDCAGVVQFNLADIADVDFQAVCPVCHRAYALEGTLRDKLCRMMELIAAIRNSEDILGDSMVSVNVAGGEVRIPYALLLTRLNTLISLELAGQKTDFHLWVEPSSPDTFR